MYKVYNVPQKLYVINIKGAEHKMKTINGGNYFHEKAFNEICEALEKGEAVQVYIDCIGHTRNNYEQETYKEALIKKYSDRVKTDKLDGSYSYSYVYSLRYFACGGKNA